MAVELISNSRRDNNLGLLPENMQSGFWKKLWYKAPNDRVTIKRKAYERLYEQYKGELDPSRKEEIRLVLVSLSTRAIDEEAFDLNSDNQTIQELKTNLSRDYDLTFSRIENTIKSAMGNKYGFVAKGSGKDDNLAVIITMFSHLYKNKSENPILPDSNEDDLVVADFLRLGIPHNHPASKKRAIQQYCDKIAAAIENLARMKKSTLDMAFAGDNVKDKLIRDLKIHYNRFVRSVDHNKYFRNIKKEAENIKDKHDEQMRKRKREDDQILLSEKEHEIMTRKLKKTHDGEEIAYQLEEADINYLETEAYDKKRRMRRLKSTLLAVSIIFALIVAAGQMAIALGATIGVFTVIIGVASFTTNFFLFQRDIKQVMVDFFTGKMFKGLSARLKAALGVYFVFSFATGIVSGGLVLDLLLKLMSFTIATAPAGPFAFAAVVALVSVIGMGSLFFAVGVGIARKLKGQTLFDTRDAEGQIKKGLLNQLKDKVVKFFREPEINHQAVKIQDQIDSLNTKLAALGHDSPLRGALNSELKFLQKMKDAARRTHTARHVLTIALTILFFPLAVFFAIIATFGLMKASVSGTASFFHTSLNIAQKAAEIASNVLTWGFALVVNGALYTKNMVNAGGFFADKLGKFFIGVGYSISLFFTLLAEGRLLKTIRDSYKAFKENPAKTIYPGLRGLLLAVCAALVVANADGNASFYRENGTLPIPDNAGISGKFITYVSSFFGSATLNFLAIVDALAATPIRKLEKNDGMSYKRMGGKLGPASSDEEAANDDFADSVPLDTKRKRHSITLPLVDEARGLSHLVDNTTLRVKV